MDAARPPTGRLTIYIFHCSCRRNGCGTRLLHGSPSLPSLLVVSTMPDRVSLILDSMITVVDEGFSYDGIVSIPETGLEDVGYRTGLAGRLDDGVVRSLLLLPTAITYE